MAVTGKTEAIEDALHSRLASLTLSPTRRIAWPGITFTPVRGEIYVEPQTLWNSSERGEIGPGAARRHVGIYQLSVRGPINVDDTPLKVVADAIIEHFDRTSIERNQLRVRIGAFGGGADRAVPWRSPTLIVGGWMIVPVSVPFWCDVFPDWAPFDGTYLLTAAAGLFSLSGEAGLLRSRRFEVDAGSFSLDGYAAGLSWSRRIAADAGQIVVDGSEADLLAARLLAASHSEIILSGVAAGLRVSRRLVAEAGMFAVDGQDAGLITTGALDAQPGLFSLEGQPAALLVGRRIAAAHGSIAVSGHAAAVRASRLLAADAGAIALAGQNAGLLFNRRLASGSGIFATAGQSVALQRSYRLAADAGMFSLTGQAATLGRGYVMPTDHGAFVLAGQAAALKASRKVVGTFGSFVLTGQAATLTKMESESRALFAAMNVQPTSERKVLINTFIKALKDAGVWSKIDVLWVLAAHDEQAGRLNWKSPGTYTCTVVNSVTFTTDRGFAGDGVSGHLDTNFAPNTHAVQFTQNDAHIGVYQRTGGANGNEPFSINNASDRLRVAGGTGTSTRSNVNSATQVNGPAGGTQPIHGMGRRNDASNISVLRDGVQVTAPTSAASSAILSGNMRIGVKSTGTYVPHQVAMAHLGAYLDDTEAAALYAAANAYMVAVGADT